MVIHMKRELDFSLVLPCFNEEPIYNDSVKRIVRTLSASRWSYEIIFVDDASIDGTAKLIRKMIQTNGQMRAIFHRINEGRGRSVADGIRHAKGTVVGYIDIDLEVLPVYIPLCVTMIIDKEADVVIGKRMYRTNILSLPREVLSIGYQWLSNVMVGTGSLDTESGYKFFNRKKILPIIAQTRHKHWFWDTEIMVLAKRKGLRIAEVPVLFLRRFDKTSSVRIIGDSFEYIKSLFALRKRLKAMTY